MNRISPILSVSYYLTFIAMLHLMSCSNIQTPDSPTSNFVSVEENKQAAFFEKSTLNRQDNITLDMGKTASLFNDSLSITLEYFPNTISNYLWLYVISKELGESRKFTMIKPGDIFKIDGYDELRDGYQIEIINQYHKPNNEFESIDISVSRFKSNQ